MKKIFLLPLLILSLASGCKNYDGKKAEKARNEWLDSLNDSIAILEKSRSEDSLQLERLRISVEEKIADFSTVNNPKEVEEYYILKSFRNSYPLENTGIAARILRNEGLEIIAALSGARFNSIRANSADESCETHTVPPDQALNYYSGGLTTVAFSGPGADSLAMLISSRQSSEITLEYLENGVARKSIRLSDSQKRWIAGTWSLCKTQKRIHDLENSMLLSSRKIQILKITLDRQNDQNKK